jgi:hypothetical protein
MHVLSFMPATMVDDNGSPSSILRASLSNLDCSSTGGNDSGSIATRKVSSTS